MKILVKFFNLSQKKQRAMYCGNIVVIINENKM